MLALARYFLEWLEPFELFWSSMTALVDGGGEDASLLNDSGAAKLSLDFVIKLSLDEP